MKNLKLKIVNRNGIVETNSSSSHAVSISMTGNLVQPGDDVWDLDIRDGVLYIPKHQGFGWNYFKTNKCQEKLQYVCGLVCYDLDTVQSHKRVHRLTEFLKSFLGVSDVKFEWIEELKDDDDYPDYIEVDHQSRDLDEEILENKDTLINFIFNPLSWLYGGNDNDVDPRGFKKEVETYNDDYEAILSLEVENIGRVDVPIHSLSRVNEEFSEDVVIRNLRWREGMDNPELYLPTFHNDEDYAKNYSQRKEEERTYLTSRSFHPIITIDNKVYLLLFHTSNTVDLKKYLLGEERDNNPGVIYTEGKDYKLFELSILLTEFGKV